MGARVYISALGRFLSIDSKEGGTDNNYAYENDPVNSFDLDGNAGFWSGIRKSVQKAARWAWKNRDGIAAVASIGLMFVPGVGAAVGVARVAMLAQKVSIVARGVRAVGAAARVVKATKAGVSIGRQLYASKAFGISSKLFGNARFGLNGAGKLNNYGKVRIGWSHFGTQARGSAVFRIGIAKKHIILFRVPRLW